MSGNIRGPLFIVGASRSGTKLLRNILNGHSKIGVPLAESHFIPYLVHRFSSNDLIKDQELGHLSKVIKQSMFFQSMKRRGVELNSEDIKQSFSDNSLPEGIKNFMIRSIEKQEGRELDLTSYWGDKTPSYLEEIQLLKNTFPYSRFVHIVRDPRARALSAHSAWGADVFISVDRWRRTVAKSRQIGKEIGSDWMELRYEDLVFEPAVSIKKICEQLSLEFEPQMLELKVPVENLGDQQQTTRKDTRITTNRAEVWRDELEPKVIRRLDELGLPEMKDMGYSPLNMGSDLHIPLNFLERYKGLLKDYWGSFKHHVVTWGVFRGIRHLLWRRRMASITPKDIQK